MMRISFDMMMVNLAIRSALRIVAAITSCCFWIVNLTYAINLKAITVTGNLRDFIRG